MRVVNGGRTTHPWHTHGQDAIIIAIDGSPLQSSPAQGIDRSFRDFTVQVHPGTSYDYLFNWTGEDLGWDIYGTPGAPGHDGSDHSCNGISLSVCLADNDPSDCGSPGFDAVTREYCPDHGKAIPVILPTLQTIGIGGFWSGSAYMGQEGALPPGEGGLNLNSGYHIMWHSHNAREQVNNDEPPGGMTTMMVVEPPGTTIP
jgi:hypothetical protein